MDSTVSAWGNTSTPLNEGDEEFSENLRLVNLILNFVSLFISLVGLAGNATVLWLLGFRMRKSAILVYIFNLASADFLFLSLQFINSLMNIIEFFHFIPITVTISTISNILITLSIFAYLTDLSILSAISMERCLSVLYPIWYHSHRPRNMSAVVCTLLWIMSLMLNMQEWIYCHPPSTRNHTDCCPVVDFITVAWLIFTFVLLTGSSLVLMLRLLCGSRRMRLTRLYVTVGLTVLVFFICGLPFGIHWFLVCWLQRQDYPIEPHIVAYLLSCLNSCANPTIYFFVGSFRQRQRKQQKLRQTLKLVLKRALEDTSEMDLSEGSLPPQTLEMSGSRQVY